MNLTPQEQNFVNKLAESIIFKDWIDESCGNFIGWVKDFDDHTLSVHRIKTNIGGLYYFSKMKKGYKASDDYMKNLLVEKSNMSLYDIHEILK